jgi:hypothetical protein
LAVTEKPQLHEEHERGPRGRGQSQRDHLEAVPLEIDSVQENLPCDEDSGNDPIASGGFHLAVAAFGLLAHPMALSGVSVRSTDDPDDRPITRARVGQASILTPKDFAIREMGTGEGRSEALWIRAIPADILQSL